MNAKMFAAVACLYALPLVAQQHDDHENDGAPPATAEHGSHGDPSDRAQGHDMDMGCMNTKARMEDMQKRMDAMQRRMDEMERERGRRRER